MNTATKIKVSLLTPPAPGAVAIFQLSGAGVETWVTRLTGKSPSEKAALVSFGQIDEGLQLKVAEQCVQFMPHGGPRVMSQLLSWLISNGAFYDSNPQQALDGLMQVYPETRHALEAITLFCISQAESPAAVELLWNEMQAWETRLSSASFSFDQAEISHPYDRILKAPRIVLAGPPNAGKSTLSNLLSGQATSITANEPGTTRDWVGHRVELNCDLGAFLVDWSDTPGIRQTEDAIEAEAIGIARELLEEAEVLIAIRSLGEAHSDFSDWPKAPDLLLVNKCDLQDQSNRSPIDLHEIQISSLETSTPEILGHSIAEALGFFSEAARKPWFYHPLLKKSMADYGFRQRLLQQ